MPRIDIVIVTYNSCGVIDDLLDSIPAGLDGLDAAVVVVDSGSTDATVERLHERSDCLVIETENHGYAAGINRGVTELAGQGPVLVLNPDVRLEPGAIRALLDALTLPSTGIVAPRVLDPGGSTSLSLRRTPTLARALGLGRTGVPWLSEYVTDEGEYEQRHVVDWALGAALLVARACHEEVGGWDESFFLYSEETDLCLRGRELGWVTRYTPDAVVHHVGGASGRSAQTHVMQIVNRVRLYARRHGPAAAWAYWALTILTEMSWLARGHSQSFASVRALLIPRLRPPEMRCSEHVLPRQ